MFSPTSTNAQRFGVGLNLAVGTASVFSSGDRSLQQSLRALSIASGVWNTGTSLIAAKQSMTATLRTVSAVKQPRRVRYVAADPEESDDGGLAQVPPEYALKDKSDDAITARIRDRFRRGDPIVHEFIMENDVRFGYRKSEDGVFDDRTIDEISFGYVKYIVESNLKDGDGKTFQRALFHRDVSEYQILATTQRAIRSMPSFKARETEYYRVNPIPESTDDWIRPGSPEYDQLIARRQEAYYTWMGDMGATESEVTWARTRANIIDTIKPGGYLEQIVHMAAATRTAQIGSSKLKGGVAQEYKIAPPAPPRAPTQPRPSAPATENHYSSNFNARAEPPAVPRFNWRSPQVLPSPDAQNHFTMPRLNNNGTGQPYGTPLLYSWTASLPTKAGSNVSRAAAALSSHARRSDWKGPQPKGSPAAVNAQAYAIVASVMNDPNATFTTRPHSRAEWGGTVTDVYRPDGLGVRYDANGNFVTFIGR
jgi:hypothetical protein